MKLTKLILPALFFVFLIILANQSNAQNNCLKGWTLDGNKWDNYEMGCDTIIFHSGNTSAYLKSVKQKIKGFGTIMQAINAGQYHGKRIRFSAWVKAKDVDDWAGLWMRVDDYNVFNIALSFDNMFDRPVKGTKDWQKFSIVLDVPVTGSKILLGALLSGTGKIWMDDVKIEIVDNTVPVTGMDHLPEAPGNVGFEER